MKLQLAVFASLLSTFTANALAHGDETKSSTQAAAEHSDLVTPYGRAGQPGKARRTIKIGMKDTMRFTPDHVTVKRGETVRFIVHNDGKLLHELVLGRAEDLEKHAVLMRRFPEMEHDEPNMVHVQPGKTGEVVWTFDKPGTFGFACLIAGHFEAGMTGKVTVK